MEVTRGSVPEWSENMIGHGHGGHGDEDGSGYGSEYGSEYGFGYGSYGTGHEYGYGYGYGNGYGHGDSDGSGTGDEDGGLTTTAVEAAQTTNHKPHKQEQQMKKSGERPVLVTTEFRGVFFGYATDTAGENIIMKRARNCVYWSADVRGFLGLAATGPSQDCRVGPPADIDLRKVTCVAEVSAEAVKAWESAPWK